LKPLEKNYKRIVIKIGSSLFLRDKDLDMLRLFDIVSNISRLIKMEKKEVIIVSSGAIALGMDLLKLKNRPKELPFLQAAAAIGQNVLMDNYSKYFKKYGITCSQILLTWDDFDNRQRYLNAKNTLATLLKLGAIPVINENDTISTEEIKFGDNDRLSALVATLINAGLLIMLSDVEGLLDRNKKIIKIVDEITPQIYQLACPTNNKICVGGMVTKIDAAKIAVDSGIPCVIANGLRRDILSSVLNRPEENGTLFIPKRGYLAARKRWIAFGTKPKGSIRVDDGAKKALLNKKSLLSVGVAELDGNFEVGDIVSVIDMQNCEFARGRAGISSKQIDKIKGQRYDKEVIHRNNIVIL